MLAYGCLPIIQLCFSGWHVLGKIALTDGAVDPLIFAFFREISATAMMIAIGCVSYVCQKKNVENDNQSTTSQSSFALQREDLVRFTFLGFCSFCNVVGFVVALSLVSPFNASAFQPSIPVFAMMFSVAAGFEKLTAMKVVGLLAAVAGATLMALGSAESAPEGSAPWKTIVGNGMLVVQCSAMAGLLVFQKPLIGRYHPAMITVYYYGIGAVMTVVTSLIYITKPDKWKFHGSDDDIVNVWIALIYAAIVATVFTYMLYTWALKYVEATVVSLFSTFQAVGTALLQVLILRDGITWQEILGGVFIVCGLFIVTASKIREAQVKKEADKEPLIGSVIQNEKNEP